jgi:radical SAM protein with 4Fe4S-binding SPASM domain
MCDLPLGENVEIKITGGESSLFIDDIRYAYKKIKKVEKYVDTRIRFTTISNGTNMEGLLGLMDEGILDPWGCKFSWDGLYSCSKSRLPKNKTYTDEYFNNKIKVLGQSKWHDSMLVRMAVTPNTVDHMFDSLVYCLDNNCHKWEYYFLTDCEEYKTPEFIKKFNEQIRLIADEYNRRPFNYYNWDTLKLTELILPRTDNETKLRSIGCRHLGTSMYVAENGDIYPCGFFVPDSEYGSCHNKIGNLSTGFVKPKVKEFVSEYLEQPMCEYQTCENLHCFECPALTKHRTGRMNNKLCQACGLRDAERKVFHEKHKFVIDEEEQLKKQFFYTQNWKIKADNEKLRWSNEE